jgi:hypothetical protein
MSINVNIKRTFKVNGKEYTSIEEMPSEIRSAFEKTMASQAGKDIFSVNHTKINFNGIEYKSIEKMPPDIRQLYEKVLKAAETGNMPPGLATAGDIIGSRSESKAYLNIGSGNMGTPIKAEVTFSWRTLVIGIGLIALIIILYLMFQGKG